MHTTKHLTKKSQQMACKKQNKRKKTCYWVVFRQIKKKNEIKTSMNSIFPNEKNPDDIERQTSERERNAEWTNCIFIVNSIIDVHKFQLYFVEKQMHTIVRCEDMRRRKKWQSRTKSMRNFRVNKKQLEITTIEKMTRSNKSVSCAVFFFFVFGFKLCVFFVFLLLPCWSRKLTNCLNRYG